MPSNTDDDLMLSGGFVLSSEVIALSMTLADPKAEPIDHNSVTEDQLKALPGIGAA